MTFLILGKRAMPPLRQIKSLGSNKKHDNVAVRRAQLWRKDGMAQKKARESRLLTFYLLPCGNNVAE
jgi:hypothetical protein